MAVKIKKGVPYSGALPAVISDTKAGYLHSYKIFGNTEQTGTPTPENPIEPSECGERTGNLFNENATDTNNGYDASGRYLTYTGDYGGTAGGTWRVSEYIKIDPSSTYILSGFTTGVNPSYCFYGSDKSFISGVRYGSQSILTITSPNNAEYIRFSRNVNTDDVTMLIEGSTTPSTYIPYGYKLPLLSGSTPVDIYLGESQTTRRIKKLVLTGEESNINLYVRQGTNGISIGDILPTSYLLAEGKCSHYIVSTNYSLETLWIGAGNRHIYFVGILDVLGLSTVSDFKTYLAQQYANGTPVTIWYVLSEPETGTLNEPLRKIGDYADTIDSTQTSTQIPTSADRTTISWAGEGLAPSQFDSIAEWVSATPKIYRSGAWVDAQTYTYTNGAWVADN